jgi:hypothetical protein
MFEEDDQKKAEKHQSTLAALSIENESLDQQVDALFKELQVTPEQISQFIKNEQNFTQENWEFLKQERKKLDEKLLLSLTQVSNLKKIKDKRAQQAAVQPHWLFIR